MKNLCKLFLLKIYKFPKKRYFYEIMSSFFCKKQFFLQSNMDISFRSTYYNTNFIKENGGFFIPHDSVNRKIMNLEPWDLVRRDMIILLLRTIVLDEIHGNLAELGVYKGLTAKLIHHYVPEKKLYLFDSFEGFNVKDLRKEEQETNVKISSNLFLDTNVEIVKKNINPVNDNVEFLKGNFPFSITDSLKNELFSFVHLDADLYFPILKGLEFFYPRLSTGGILLIHDYNAWLGARKATDEFFKNKKEKPIPMPDKSGSAIVLKL
jgi:O-methyltransferase